MVFETILQSDLQKMVNVKQLTGNLFSADNGGNKITVEILDGGAPATVSGSVYGYAIREDEKTVVIEGTLSGNKASIVLPASAYAVIGKLNIVIKVGTATVGACSAYVYRTTTDAIVDPGSVVPDISELLAQIGACEEATTAANTAATAANTAAANVGGNLAANYSTSAAYAVGDYCIKDGTLYRCTTAITSGENWNSAHWTAAKIGPDVSALKSAFINTTPTVANDDDIYPLANIQGLLKADDTIGSAAYVHSDYIKIPEGATGITICSAFRYGGATNYINPCAVFYNSSKEIISAATGVSEKYAYYAIPSEAKYIRFNQVREGNGNITVYDSGFWFNPTKSERTIDTMSTRVENITGNRYVPLIKGYNINTPSNDNYSSPNANSSWCYAIIDAAEGNTFTLKGTGGNDSRFWAFADSTGKVISRAVNGANGTDVIIVAPANTSKLIFNSTIAASPYLYKGKTVKTRLNYLEGESNPYSEFTVNANGTHSSSVDMVDINGYTGDDIVVCIESDLPATFQIYRRSESEGTAYKTITGKAFAEEAITLPADTKYIGVYVNNQNASAIKVRVTVFTRQPDYIINAQSMFGDGIYLKPNALAEEFCALLNHDLITCDTFFFFSDPHIMASDSILPERHIIELRKDLAILRAYAEECFPATILCGGDWLRSGDTKDMACYKLRYLSGLCHDYLSKYNYHNLLGNHDTNYQGKDTEESAANTGRLSIYILNNILYNEEDTKKAYFSYKTPETTYYCLDTGIDGSPDMTDYRWTQMNWLATHLRDDDPENSIVGMHIFSYAQTAENFGTDDLPMSVNTVAIIKAYNTRSTITVNGTTYNFTGKTGYVRCILTGHTHYDTIYTADDNLPVVCITDATDYLASPIKFDMGFCDYTNKKLTLIRVNDTDNVGTREVDLR